MSNPITKDEGESQATTLDERLAEMEKKSVMFSDSQSTTISEETVLVKSTSGEILSTATVQTITTEEPTTNTTSSNNSLPESTELFNKTFFAFGLGGVIGAIVTSLIL